MTLPQDARIYQILFLATLLSIGVLVRDFSLQPEQMALTFAAGLATQALFVKLLGLRNVGYLLRADTLWAHPLAAFIAIGAKFVIRVNGKHLFNPANLGVIAGLTLIPGAWISPGQWGNDLVYAAWFVALGSIVVNRAQRMDISWMFLGCYVALLGARVLWLGQSGAIFWHQLHSGALLLFTFFMISDPMTIPNHQRARLCYAALVAAGAYLWQFYLFKPNSLVWALFLLTPLVPLLDRLWPAQRHAWRVSNRNAHKAGLVHPAGA
jgi:Na+-transporting NADH:ubiquinone oxidoreductase subunit NqrB